MDESLVDATLDDGTEETSIFDAGDDALPSGGGTILDEIAIDIAGSCDEGMVGDDGVLDDPGSSYDESILGEGILIGAADGGEGSAGDEGLGDEGAQADAGDEDGIVEEVAIDIGLYFDEGAAVDDGPVDDSDGTSDEGISVEEIVVEGSDGGEGTTGNGGLVEDGGGAAGEDTGTDDIVWIGIIDWETGDVIDGGADATDDPLAEESGPPRDRGRDGRYRLSRHLRLLPLRFDRLRRRNQVFSCHIPPAVTPQAVFVPTATSASQRITGDMPPYSPNPRKPGHGEL